MALDFMLGVLCTGWRGGAGDPGPPHGEVRFWAAALGTLETRGGREAQAASLALGSEEEVLSASEVAALLR